MIAKISRAEDSGLWFVQSRVNIRVSRADTPERISVLEHRCPPGFGPPVHVHHDEDEVFHILEGEVRYEVGTQALTARTGDTVTAPRGVPHGFKVISAHGARILTITRGGFEDLVRAVSRPASAPGLPAMDEPPSPELQALLARRGSENGIDLLGPPIA
jgi:quercetin dioxygenase-like cupin family protein